MSRSLAEPPHSQVRTRRIYNIDLLRETMQEIEDTSVSEHGRLIARVQLLVIAHQDPELISGLNDPRLKEEFMRLFVDSRKICREKTQLITLLLEHEPVLPLLPLDTALA